VGRNQSMGLDMNSFRGDFFTTHQADLPMNVGKNRMRGIVSWIWIGSLCTLFVCTVWVNPAAGSDRLKTVGLFSNFENDVVDSFSGNHALYHAAGVAATYALVHLNVDFRVHSYFKNHRNLSHSFHPVVMTGSVLTPVAGMAFYMAGRHKKDPELLGLGSALLQTQIIASMTVGLLKGITGRPHPDPNSGEDMKKMSRTFRFGFLRGGLFWGWPSGHAASTMALVSTLTAYYPDNAWIKFGGAALMGYTILGVSAVGGGRMHWFSDAVAASFMAYAIGHTVGGYYHREAFHQEPAVKPGKVQASVKSLYTFPIVRFAFAF